MSNSSFSRAVFAPQHVEMGSVSFPAISALSLVALITACALVAANPAKSWLSQAAIQSRAPQNQYSPANLSPSAHGVLQTSRSHANANTATLPLAFEPNVGQSDAQVKYLARGRGYSLFLTANSAYFAMPGPGHTLRATRSEREARLSEIARNQRKSDSRSSASRNKHDESNSIQMEMLGSNSAPQIVAENELPGVTNYLLGRDPANWHSGVAHYNQVRYRNVYPGVDLAYHGASQRGEKFEFDFLLNPGATPKQINLKFRGVQNLRTSSSGDLTLTSAAGDLHLRRPFAYQENNGVQQFVDAHFVIGAKNRVSFALGEYDHTRQLVIDPTVTYSTYLGGSLEDDANAIAVDASGNTYITGETDSTNFTGAANAPVGTFDVFVTKLSPSGTLAFTTLVGGSQEDIGFGVAVDSSGIYVTGETFSSDFPATIGQTNFLAGPNHGFLFKLNSSGTALTWSTLIEGTAGESALALAVDAAQDIYVVGATFSTDLGLGTVNALPGGSALNNGAGPNGDDDGFIAKIKSDGSQYLFLSYLGGSSIDTAQGVALDAAGNVYVAGFTNSTDFPTQPGAFQPACGTDGNCNPSGGIAQDDAFVLAITPSDAPTYIYSTYLGGEKADEAFAIAVDASGNAYVTGQTKSTNFPHPNALTNLSTLLGTQNAFVASLKPDGTALSYSTYLGGTGSEAGFGIAVDGSSNAYVTGYTTSVDFPVTSSTSTFGSGGIFGTDAFVSELNLNGTSLSLPFSTYLGGSGDEDFVFGALAVDTPGNIYVTGVTNSSDFPVVKAADGAYNSSGGTCTLASGGSAPCPDAFVTVYAPTPSGDFSIAGTALSPVNAGSSSSSIITITAFHGYSNTVNLTCTVTGGGTPAPTCSFSAASVSGGSGTSTLTVSTTAATALLQTPGQRHGTIFYASLFPVAGFAFIGLAAYPAKGKKRLAAILGLLALLTLLLSLPACGGGGSSNTGGGGGGGNPGTPAGNYTITVTGTDGSITHSIAPPLTLTVN